MKRFKLRSFQNALYSVFVLSKALLRQDAQSTVCTLLLHSLCVCVLFAFAQCMGGPALHRSRTRSYLDAALHDGIDSRLSAIVQLIGGETHIFWSCLTKV